MVVQATQPEVTPGYAPPETRNGASTGYRSRCPRCEAHLVFGYDEPECLRCGYADYEYTPPPTARAKKSVLSTATHYVLRYVGDFPKLADTLAYVRLRRVRNRVVYWVACPFCNLPMTESSLSGKRREIREERFKCAYEHRVSLTPNRNGSLGWK